MCRIWVPSPGNSAYDLSLFSYGYLGLLVHLLSYNIQYAACNREYTVSNMQLYINVYIYTYVYIHTSMYNMYIMYSMSNIEIHDVFCINNTHIYNMYIVSTVWCVLYQQYCKYPTTWVRSTHTKSTSTYNRQYATSTRKYAVGNKQQTLCTGQYAWDVHAMLMINHCKWLDPYWGWYIMYVLNILYGYR